MKSNNGTGSSNQTFLQAETERKPCNKSNVSIFYPFLSYSLHRSTDDLQQLPKVVYRSIKFNWKCNIFLTFLHAWDGSDPDGVFAVVAGGAVGCDGEGLGTSGACGLHVPCSGGEVMPVVKEVKGKKDGECVSVRLVGGAEQ